MNDSESTTNVFNPPTAGQKIAMDYSNTTMTDPAYLKNKNFFQRSLNYLWMSNRFTRFFKILISLFVVNTDNLTLEFKQRV